MSFPIETALTTAIVSLITAFSGIIFSIVRIRKEKKERQHQFQTKLAELESKFLHERVVQRYKTYPKVFKLLGTVRDVSDPKQEHYRSLLKDRKKLLETADNLLIYLYGDAGLLMEWQTRNALLNTYLACHYFQDDTITLYELAGYFYLARRWLRADLQIEDIQKVKSKFEEIRKKFGTDESDKKLNVDERFQNLEKLTRGV